MELRKIEKEKQGSKRNKIVPSPSEVRNKAEVLDKYFASCFEIEGPGVLPKFHDRNFDQILSHIDVNEEVIWKAVHRLKPFKLQGPDNLHPKLIKKNVKRH